MATGVELSSGIGQAPVITTDGTTLIYKGTKPDSEQLFRRAMNAIAPVPIDGTKGALSPFASPDGKWIGFLVGDTVKKVPVRGGVPTAIASAARGASGVSWGSDGVIVVGSRAGVRALPL